MTSSSVSPSVELSTRSWFSIRLRNRCKSLTWRMITALPSERSLISRAQMSISSPFAKVGENTSPILRKSVIADGFFRTERSSKEALTKSFIVADHSWSSLTELIRLTQRSRNSILCLVASHEGETSLASVRIS